MTVDRIILAIESILRNQLMCRQMHKFHPDARLAEDLYLDSILMMQLLLALELDCDLSVPDEAISAQHFSTVRHLAHFMLQRSPQEPQTPAAEAEFDDIKVHCVVSCLCDIIPKDDPAIDHRPFYFAVPDAEIVIDESHGLTYHHDRISHDLFTNWFYRLYNVAVISWYRPEWSKAQNTATLLQLLEQKTQTERIMVMLDLYRLPQRENKFNRDPFPHYAMLETTDDPDHWLMRDPDFRWQGVLPKADILHAIASEHVAGGFMFDAAALKPATNEVIRDYFNAVVNLDSNGLTNAIRQVLQHHLSQDPTCEHLEKALESIPVLAIRKYGYEHALAFFMRAGLLTGDEFETWCITIEELVSQFRLVLYYAIKLARNEPLDTAQQHNRIQSLLHTQDQREFAIKKRLSALFQQWCNIQFSASQTPIRTKVSS